MMIFIVGIYDQPWGLPVPGVHVWLSLIALAVFGTALAYLLYFKILKQAGATNVLLVTLLVPVTAVVLGAVFLDETIRIREINGALIIAFALICLDGRVFKLLVRKPASR